MGTVSNLSAISAASASTLGQAGKTLGKDDFLKMLIAQLKNQNPLNPMDGTDFAAQLAQYSSLEQLYNINSQLKSLQQSDSSLGLTQATGLIGKEVSATGSNAFTTDGPSASLSYQLDGNAKDVSVTIYDGEGHAVDSLSFENQKQGLNTISWNCGAYPMGRYTFEVSATDASGEDVAAKTATTGVVTNVQYKDGGVYLTINGQQVALSDVVSVRTAAQNQKT